MKSVEQWLLFIFLIFVIIANVSNSANQILTLFRVQNIVSQQGAELDQLEKEKARLQAEVAYAQSGEYQQRAWRILLGLGNKEDYWLLLPKQSDLSSVYPQAEKENSLPHWKEWWNFFVGKP
ncbi:hypothetical protein M1116_01810 [Patescibacteria group bacterium]|nr:hypothetical protein [Patescibacteria group bacterium]